jgi:raffinose/stachyose/melibiose transport system permease protein
MITLRSRIQTLKGITAELLILLLSLIVLIPVAIMVFGSFKSSPEAAKLSLELPKQWHFENYKVVIEKGKIGRALLNSIFITGSSVFMVVLVSAMSAFYLVRRNNTLSKWVMQLYYLGLVAPMSIITTIKLLQWLDLSSTFFAVIMIFVSLSMPFSVFLFSGFIKSIPRELDESGIIDGCSPFRLFFWIIFPLLLPVVVTCAIVAFMTVWNDINVPLFFLNKSDKWTMPLTVYAFFGRYQRDWNLVFADLIISAAPVALFYFFGQRFIIEGMTAGAVKG